MTRAVSSAEENKVMPVPTAWVELISKLPLLIGQRS
jgi:hypothetical protein